MIFFINEIRWTLAKLFLYYSETVGKVWHLKSVIPKIILLDQTSDLS